MKKLINNHLKNVTRNLSSDIWLVKQEIDDEGAKIIAEFLKDNVHVTVINLSLNNIGDKGFKALADALKYNTVVKELIITGNNLNQKGMEALVDIFKTNAVVELICFQGNPVDEYPNIRNLYDRNKEYGKIITNFVKNFDEEKILYSDIKKLKLSQKINLDYKYPRESGAIKQYIKNNFSKISGLYKSLDSKSLLPEEILNLIFSFLSEQSLWQINYTKITQDNLENHSASVSEIEAMTIGENGDQVVALI